MNNYNWKEPNLSEEPKDQEKLESNKKPIALNFLFLSHHKEEIKQTYISNHDLNRENKVIPLMINNGKKWQYLAVKILPILLQGITSNNQGQYI